VQKVNQQAVKSDLALYCRQTAATTPLTRLQDKWPSSVPSHFMFEDLVHLCLMHCCVRFLQHQSCTASDVRPQGVCNGLSSSKKNHNTLFDQNIDG